MTVCHVIPNVIRCMSMHQELIDGQVGQVRTQIFPWPHEDKAAALGIICSMQMMI